MPDLFPPFGPFSNPLAGSPIGWQAPQPGAPITPASYLAEVRDANTG